jgi:type VI secretion system protein ImpL
MPHATNLDVKCPNQDFTMVNLNYPVRKTINWSPDSCGDVVFSIEVDNLVLTRKYTGSDAFPRFLQDFSTRNQNFLSQGFSATSIRFGAAEYHPYQGELPF